MPRNGRAVRKPETDARRRAREESEARDALANAEARRVTMGRKGLELALEAAGGGSALGRAVGLSRQAISKWQWIPEEYLHRVGRVTGIEIEQLRPDLFRR